MPSSAWVALIVPMALTAAPQHSNRAAAKKQPRQEPSRGHFQLGESFAEIDL